MLNAAAATGGDVSARRFAREWVVFLLVVLAVAAFGAHSLWLERDRIAGQEQERLRLQAELLEQTLNHQLGAIHAALAALREAQEASGAAASTTFLSQRRLRDMALMMPGVSAVSVTDSTGRVLQSSRPDTTRLEMGEQGFFRAAARAPNVAPVHLAAPFQSGRNGGQMEVVLRLTDRAGNFAGILAATVDPTYLADLLGAVRYAPDVRTRLLRDVDKEQETAGGSAKPVPGPAPPARGASPAVRGSGTAPQALMTAWKPLRLPGMSTDLPMQVAASRDVAGVYAQWRSRVATMLQLGGVALAGSAAILWLAQRRRRLQQQFTSQRDIERKAHAERLDFMLAGADVGLWDWNIVAGTVLFNDRWHAMLGRISQQSSHPADHWFSRVHQDDLPALMASLARHWRGDAQVHEVEYRMWHDAGHCVWILDRAKVVQWGADGVAQRMVGAHMDVSQHKQAEESLRISETRFRALTELSSDWYWELDDRHCFVRFEGYSDTEIGMPKEDNLGLTRWDLGALNMSAADWAEHRRALDAHEVFQDLELQRMDPAGSVYWVSVSGAPIFDSQGVFRGYRGIGRSITERKRVEDEIERLAFYDALTGLPNRRLLLDRLEAALARCRSGSRRGALLFIDLDNFKNLNDTMGHDVGDSLLERVANRLVTCVKSGDTVARLGGDEFVVMLEGLPEAADTATERARGVGERVLAALNHPYLLDGYQHHSTPSLGIALFDGEVSSVEDLLKRADLAMYEAKAAGRNTLCFFAPAMQQAVIERSMLETDLRSALGHDELRLYYQAVVDREGVLGGVEALLRWRHPERGLVAPGDFIPLAEQTGLILPIGDWVVEQACRQLLAWTRQPETRALTISVNVSVRQFRQSQFAERMQAIIERVGAPAALLKFELTESLLAADVEDVIRKMAHLRALGVGFTLDDFGTGYSSLSYLKRLPLDELKIDQSFVHDVLTDANDAAIVRTILALAESLDLAVVAEGVETQGQLDFLVSHGCRAFQGYLFGRPAPMQVMLASLRPAPAPTPVSASASASVSAPALTIVTVSIDGERAAPMEREPMPMLHQK